MDWNNINTDKDTSGLGPIEYDQSKVPQLIRKHADNVRGKSHGQQVREAQARNAEIAGLIADEARTTADTAHALSTDTQNRFNDQMAENTDINEVIDGRRPAGATITYPTLNARLESMRNFVNASDFGAVGDGVTDDTQALQNALDYLSSIGGGKLLLDYGTFLITQALLMKTTNDDGGYDNPIVEIKGKGNKKSKIVKDNTATVTVKDGETTTTLDASVVTINGATMDLNDVVSSVKFTDVRIENNSTGNLTYAVYIKVGSRLINSYASFVTLKSTTDLANHNRYAFYVGSSWATSMRDCTYHGDHGFYMGGNSTSLLLENTFTSCLKNGYRISADYSTLINTYGDYGQGTLFNFHFATANVLGLGAESPLATDMISLFNSNVTIESATIFKNETDPNANLIRAQGSKLHIKQLTVVTFLNSDFGNFIKDNTLNNIQIDNINFSGTGKKFATSDFKGATTNSEIKVFMRDTKPIISGTTRLLDLPSKSKGTYQDFYVTNQKYKINNLVFGLKSPHVNTAGESVNFNVGNADNDIYLNADFTDRKVLGWVSVGSGTDLNASEFKYVPLILSGATNSRPSWATTGMQYFDTTLRKPVWWSGTAWVDATGTTV